MFNQLKLQSQMMLVSIICALAIIAMTMYALNEIGRVQSLEVEYEQQRELLYLSERAQKSLAIMNTQEIRFYETGELFFADKFSENLEMFRTEIMVLSKKDRKNDFTDISQKIQIIENKFAQIITTRRAFRLNETIVNKLDAEQKILTQHQNDLMRLIGHKSFAYDSEILPLMHAAKTARQNMQYNLIISMVVALVVCLVAGAVVTGNVTNQYQFTLSYLRKLAKGDYNFKISSEVEENELGKIAKNLKKVQGRLEEMDEPEPLTGPLREKILENANVIDLNKKRVQRQRNPFSGALLHPRK